MFLASNWPCRHDTLSYGEADKEAFGVGCWSRDCRCMTRVGEETTSEEVLGKGLKRERGTTFIGVKH